MKEHKAEDGGALLTHCPAVSGAVWWTLSYMCEGDPLPPISAEKQAWDGRFYWYLPARLWWSEIPGRQLWDGHGGNACNRWEQQGKHTLHRFSQNCNILFVRSSYLENSAGLPPSGVFVMLHSWLTSFLLIGSPWGSSICGDVQRSGTWLVGSLHDVAPCETIHGQVLCHFCQESLKVDWTWRGVHHRALWKENTVILNHNLKKVHVPGGEQALDEPHSLLCSVSILLQSI